ncbi:MAG: hypothetical protein IJ673_09140 [Treponema sp.]|nr:hypothetical protein [Treponema sp.]
MKKHIVLFCLSALLSLFAFGCGSDSEDSESDSLTGVSISGSEKARIGKSATLTATPKKTGSPEITYSWSLSSDSQASLSATTGESVELSVKDSATEGDSVTVTVTATWGTVSVTGEKTVTFSTTPTLSLTDTPVGYATEGDPSWNTDKSKIVTVTNAKDLKSYASAGGYVIYVDGMIDMTTDNGSASMLPTSASDDNANLGNFIANHYGNWSGTKYTSWSAWRTAYAAANSSTSDWDSSSSKNADSMDGYEYQLYNDYKNQIMIKPASNTTIIGKTSESGIKGGSFYIEGSSSTEKKNIQIRNLIIRDAFDPFPHHETSSSGSSDGWNAQYDGITLKGTNVSNIWIDHCTFEDTISVGWNGFATVAVSDGEETGNHKNMWQTYDGMLDIAGTVENVTISYCKFVNHDKVMLLGNDSSDSGTKTITVHHCYFKDSVQRLPMVRYANVHLYNNYYTFSKSEGYTSTSTVNVRDSAKVNSEYNYFDFTGDLKYSYSDGGNSTGSLYYANDYGVASSNISLSSMGSKASTSTKVFDIPYTYTPDAASDVPSIVEENAGAGVCNVVQ